MRKKQFHPKSKRLNLKPVFASLLLALSAHTAQANPIGAAVVSGQASFATKGNTLTVTNTPNAIINWQGFSIGANEITRFAQQSASSAVLNRVIANNPSNILGSLQSNGRVFLVNPSGIVFGANATVNVAGMVASTLNISNADFLAGRYRFSSPRPLAGEGPGERVSNAGSITAQSGGQIYLIAPNVENTGIINAPNGEILLAAGHSVELVNSNDPNLRVNITAPAGNATNVGQLVASSGSLGLFGTVVRNSGTVSADSATMQGGKIVFKASQRVDAGGIISATGTSGGTINVLADMQTGTVNVTGTLDASSNAVRPEPVEGQAPSLSVTTPSPSATLLPLPQGGEGTTLPSPLAGEGPGERGNSTNGGFIETSAAHVNIADTARVTTASGMGLAGTWLIDPFDFTIAASGGNMTGAVLTANLAGGNISILSTTGNSGTLGDVNVNDIVTWSVYKLTLNAQNNININAALNGSGSASLALEYGQQAAAAGNTSTYNVNAAVNLPAGNNFSTKLGSNGAVKAYTVITSLGAAGSVTATDLQGMNGGLALNYALGGNIDASATSAWNTNTGFTPVGNATTQFTGTFDGLGHTVSNLTINRPATNYVGLFGFTGTGSVIENVGLVGGSNTGLQNVGGLVGFNQGTVTNSYNTGSVSGNNSVGGLVGYSTGTISNSYSTGAVWGGAYIGGLVGFDNSYLTGGSISNSYATGNVSGGTNVGGLVGRKDYGTTSNSYATGSVNGTSQIGGLVGRIINGSISNSYATGSVSGTTNIGGLVGLNQGTVSNSHWNSSIIATGIGGGTTTGTNVSGLTTTQMQTAANFTGFVFTTTPGATGNNWVMVDADGTLNNAGGAAGATRPMLASEYSTTINNAHQLQLMSMALGASYTLGSNIDASKTANSTDVWGSAGFVPVGNSTTKFTGTFDGLGRTVSNLFINLPTTNNVGLFGVTGTGSTIKNVGLAGGSVSGASYVGELVGINNGGTVSNSYATGSVSGSQRIGGLVGENGAYVGVNNGGFISNSYATGSVNGSWDTGGLVGLNNGGTTISNSYATGNVIGINQAGGLVGSFIGGTLSNAYSTGSVSGTASVGGLVGYGGGGTATNSYWNITTSGQATSGGGTGKTTAQMMQLSSFTSWNTATPNTIANTGGSGAVWRIYEGHTAPLLTSFLTPLTLTGAPDVAVTYNGAAQSGAAFTLIANVLGAAATGTNAGFYNGYYSAQQGYDLSGGNLTINPANLSVTGIAASNKTYNGTTAATLTGTAIVAALGGDVVSVGGTGSGTFADKNVGTGKAVTITGYTLGGASAGNYTIVQPAGVTANITQLASVAYTGASGNWSTAANWAGGALPDGANVAAVTIPSGVTVTYDSGVSGTTTLNTLTSSGTLAMAAGTLSLSGASTMAALNLSGGTLTSPAGLTVNDYTQTAGTLNIGGATLLQSAGSMTVNGAIASNAGGTLTLQAVNNISLGTGGSITGTVSPLNVILNSDSDGLSGGAISLATGTSIVSNGGNVTLGGGVAGNGTGNAIGNATYGNGILLSGASISTGAGNITFNGKSYSGSGTSHGVSMTGTGTGATLTTTTGAITLNALGDLTTSGTHRGMRLDVASTLTTGSGNINLTGTAGYDGDGFQMFGGSKVQSTSGLINVVGYSGNGVGADYGVRLSGVGTQITSANHITIVADSTASQGGSSNRGLFADASAQVIATGSGNIGITGLGGLDGDGIYLGSSVLVQANTGTITLAGTSGTGPSAERGIYIGGSGSTLIQSAGDITLTGTSMATTNADNHGIYLYWGSINSTGGNLTLNGTSQAGATNYGINIWDPINSAGTTTLNSDRNILLQTSQTPTGNMVLRADMNGTGAGTVTFSGTTITSAAGKRTDLYYNPTAYATPTNYSANLLGAGTNAAWMLVNDVTQLQAMNTNLAGVYALGKNIDASATSGWNAGAGFAPIGDATTNFTGTFDGLWHTVSNLTINRPTTDYVGLFGYTGTGSIIKNVGLVGGSVIGKDFVGGLVGYSVSVVSNSYATGSVSGASYVGGLVGESHSTVSNSYATGSVIGTVQHAGGLMGVNWGGTASISNSYATGGVSGNINVGGLVGDNYNTGTISNSYSTGSVGGTTNVGGLVGVSNGTTTNSYWNTTTSGKTTSAGGTGLDATQMMTMSSFTGWDIANTGGSAAVWRIYEGSTAPLLRSFLTPITLTPIFDGSASQVLTNIHDYTSSIASPNLSYLISATPGLILNSSATEGSYTAALNYTSTQQGYDISETRTITGTGSAANDLNIINPFSWGAGSLSMAAQNNININANLAKSGAGTDALLFKANNDIVVAANKGISSTTGALNVTLNSDSDATGGGGIKLDTGSSIISNGGNIVMGGGADPTSGYAVGTAGSSNSGILVLGDITAGAGNVTMNGQSALGSGIYFGTGLLSSNGIVNINGQTSAAGGGTAITTVAGVSFWNAGTRLTTATGTVTITGTSSSNNWSQGVTVDGATIETTGSGTLTLNGAHPSEGAAGWSIGINTGGLVRSTAVGGGSLNFNANSGGDWGTVFISGSSASSSGGAINVSDQSTNGIYVDATSSINAGTNGSISLTTDHTSISNTLQATGGTLTIKPFTTGTSIGIGGGAGTLQLTAANFSTNFANGFSGITIGSATTGNITANAFTFGDNLTLWAGDANANATLSGAIANAGADTSSGSLTVKSAGSITLGSNTSITTHAQPVVFWADSDNSGLGNITGGDYINIATNGGHVVLAGGADDGSYSGTTAADGIPDGYATGVNAANAAGIVLGQSTAYLASNINISSSGGNIIMRGKSYSGTDIPGAGNAFGVGFYGQPIINSGAGTLLIDGQSVTADADAYAAGLQTSGYGSGAATFTSANTTANAIKLIGSSASGNADTAPGLNAGVNFNDSTSVTATGTGGGITITGSSANGYGVHLGGWGGNQTIQTTTGAIAIDGGSRGINTQSVAVPTGFTVAIASTSGGGITLTGDAMNLERSSSSSSGTLTIQPKTTGASIGIAGGAGTLSLLASYFTTNFVDGFSGITVGSATTGTITANGFTFGDNLTLWAGNANANAVLSGTIANAGTGTSSGSLTVKATGNITSTATLTTQAQSVVFNSDSDASSAGAIMLNTGSSIASNGGDITLGGGSGAISAGVGFARGYNAAGYYNGVTVLGNLTAAGGNIVINGIADAVTNGLTNPVGVGVSGGSTASTTGAGTITLTGQSLNAGAGTVQTWGVEIGNYVGATSGTVTSVNGAILINGTAGSASNPIGSIVVNGSTVQATGTGSVTINGTAGNGLAGSQSRGIDIQGGASVLTNSGILNLNGVNTSTAASFGTIQGVVINGFGGDSKVASTSGAINIIGSTVNGVGTGVVIELPIVATKIGNGTSGDILLRSLNGTGITLTGAAINTLGNVTLDAVGGGAVTQTSGSIIASSLELLGTGATYTLNSPTNNVSNLSANTGSISFNNSGSFTVAPAGAAKFGYTANYGSGTVSVYTIDPVTGAMTLGTPVAAGTNPGSVTVAPGGKFAYVASYGSNNVSAYSIDPATGALTVVGTVASGGTGASVVTIDPSGRFAFVTNAVSNNVSVYSINSTSGALTAVGTPIAAGTGPRPITVDPTGRFVYVTNDQSNNISVYSINSSTGALTAVGTPVATGTAPRALTVDPSGRFAYVANNTSGNVSAYSIDQVTGALTATGTPIAAGGDAYSITADPSGKFVYVLNWSANNISAFSINQSTGALTAIGTPIGAGGDAYAITVDPSGKFAYVANGSVNVVSKFDINSTTGALTAAGSAPTGGAWSVSLAGGGGRVGGITATGNVSLTSGGVISGSGAVNVSTGTFTLGGGTWNQVATTLPGFMVNDFRIAGGTFIRALSGDGTVGTPYQLADIYGVQGMGSSGMLGKSYALAGNIDASGTSGWNAGAGFAPVGDATTQFTGTFDGLGHTVSNLTINRPTTNYVGLFGYTGTGVISNVGLVGGSVTGGGGYGYTGMLVGRGGSAISNSYATGNVTGTNNVGGLAGYIGGTVSSSYATGNVTGTGSNVGGLLGEGHSMVSNSYATGIVSGNNYVGGLVGFNYGTVSNSYATGSVSGTGSVGGLIGYGYWDTINNSYASGSVNGASEVGGLVGHAEGSISNSYWNSTVNVGGSVGIGGGGTLTGATGLTTAQMQQLSSFGSWNTATPNTIANTGGSGATWRIYEGHTAPLLTSFLTPLTLTGAPDVAATYNGAAQSGAAFTLITNVLGAAASGTNAGFYNGYYSAQQGYDLSGGNLTISPLAVAVALAGNKVYDGTTTFSTGQLGISNVVGGDTVSLSAGTADTADKNVGVNKPFVSFANLALAGASAGNYTLTGVSGTGTITQLASVAYTGASGNWSNAANWAGGAIPDGANVAAVTIPSGVTVTYDSGVTGTTTLNTLTSSGTLAMAAGTLALDGASSMAALNLSGGTLNGTGNVSVTNSFTQSGGSINKTGSLSINQASGALTLGNIATDTLTLAATGTVSQLTGSTLTASTFTLNSGTWNQVAATLPGFTATDFRIAGGTFIRALSGNGTSGTPYQLADIYGVQGMGSSGMLGNAYVLANNIDASGTVNWNAGAGFVPVGGAWATRFTGTFDGLGRTVSNLTINRPTTDDVGLFRIAGIGSVIQNVGLIGGNVSGSNYVGGLVGANYGTISNSYATGSVSATSNFVGGLVGGNYGTISNSYATGNVSGHINVGGLMGGNYGTVSNSYATSSVSGAANVGGLVGSNYGTISNSYATGNVTGTDVNASSTVGGLVGYSLSTGTVSNSYATGNVSGIDYVGGLVGENYGTISNSYATGSVSGNSYVGGLVGANYGTISNSFWNTTTSGRADLSDGRGTGLNTDQMMQLSSFTSWNTATPNTIASTGGSGATWRIYEGHTAPLLTSFMTGLTLTGAPDATVTYNGAAQSGAAFTLITNVLGAAATGTNAGFYNGYYSTQQGYDLTGGNLTINAAALNVIGMTGTRAYDGTANVNANIFTLSGLVGEQTLVLSGTGTVADKNVGTNKTVTLGSLALGDGSNGGLASNYTFTGGTQVASITAAAITLSTGNVSKTYDGLLTAAGTATVTGGTLFGTDSISGGTFSFTDKNAGSANKTVTATGITVNDGNSGGNYSVTYANNTASTITAASLSVTGVTATNKVYDATTAAILGGTATVAALGGDTVSVGGSVSGAFADKNAGTGKAVTVTGYTLSGTDAGNYAIVQPAGLMANINQADLTVIGITASNKTYNGTTAATLTGTAVIAALGSDVVTVGGTGSGSFANKNAGTGKPVTVTGYTLSGTDASNYAIVQPAGLMANITQADLTLSTSNVSKTYDGLLTAAGAVTVTGGTLFGGDSISGGTFAFTDKNVGSGNKTVATTDVTVNDGNSGGNYSVTYASNTASTINARALTVTAAGVNKDYDGTTAAAVTLSDNRITNDVLALANTAADFIDKNAGTGKTINVNGISVTGTDAGNYTFNTSATTAANINTRALSAAITGTPTKTYDGNTVAFLSAANYSLSGFVTGEGASVGQTTGTYNSKDVATANSITASLATSNFTATGTTLLGNYTLPTIAAGAGSITQADLTVTGVTAANKAYDATTVATLNGSAVIAALGSDVVTVGGTGSGSFANKNAGTGKPVTVTGYTLSGTDASNYSIVQPAGLMANITATSLAVTGVTAANKAYDATTVATLNGSATVAALGSDTVSVSGIGSGAFANKNTGTGKPVTVTGYTLSGTDAGNYSIVQPAGLAANITQADLTLSTSNVTKTYDGLLTAAGAVTVTGGTLFGGDTISGGSFAFTNKNVGSGNKTVTVASVTVGDGVNNTNYNISYADNTASTINARALTVTAAGVNKVYDGTTAAVVTLADNRIANDILSISNTTADFTDKNVGTGKAVNVGGITLAGTDASNYTFNTGATAAADITQAALTLSTGNITKTYDGGLAAAGVATVAGGTLFSGDTLSGGSFAFTDKNVGSGNKTVTASGITVSDGNSGANYTVSYVNNTASTITKATLSINAATDSKVYDGGTTSTGTVTYTGLVGGDTVTGATQSFGSKNVLGTNGSTLSAAGYTVVDGNSGNNYTITANTATGTITAANLAVTGVSASNKVYDDNTAAALAGTVTVAALANDVVIVSNTGSGTFADKNAGTGKAVSVTGYTITGADAGNYTLAQPAGLMANITTAPLTVAANAASKTYDGLSYSGGNGVTYSGFVNNETNAVLGGALAYSGSSQGATNAGSYIITPGGLTSGNYTIGYTDGALTVNKASLSVAANAATKTYDGLTYTSGAGVTYSGFVNNETSTVLGGTLAYGGTSQGAVNAGNYTIAANGLTSINYTLTYTGGALTVTPATLTVAAKAQSKQEGNADPLLTYMVAGLKLNDTEATTLSGALSRLAGETVGIYQINQGALITNPNYAINYIPANLDIKAAPVTATVMNTVVNSITVIPSTPPIIRPTPPPLTQASVASPPAPAPVVNAPVDTPPATPAATALADAPPAEPGSTGSGDKKDAKETIVVADAVAPAATPIAAAPLPVCK